MIITLCILIGLGIGIWICYKEKEFSCATICLSLLFVSGSLFVISNLLYGIHCDTAHTTPIQEEIYELATFEKTGDTYVISKENEILMNVDECEIRFDEKCSTPYSVKEVIYHNHRILSWATHEEVSYVIYLPALKGI